MIRKAIFLGAAVMLLGAGSASAFPPIDLATVPVNSTSIDTQGVIWTSNVAGPTGTPRTVKVPSRFVSTEAASPTVTSAP